MDRIVSSFLTIVRGTVLVGCSGDGTSPAADYRGDALCASAQVSTVGTACDLSVTMHGHTYELGCDLERGTCDCFLDSRKVPGAYGFGGTITPTCTLDFFDALWSDCCGIPER